LVYAADAIGRLFLDARPVMLARLRAASDVVVPLRAMLPAKTPVCFASMFTGAMPEVHGIRKYERPVLVCDTLFDALARAGRRVAIVAVRGCSMDIIFRNRAIDYFTENDDAAVTKRTLELLGRGKHEFIVAYHQEYDDVLHKTAPDSAEALAAAQRHVETFVLFCQAVEEHWQRVDRAVVFAPDHGAHFDTTKGSGDHGEDIPEDMEVLHCWRVRPAVPVDPTEAARQAWDGAADAWEDFVETGKDWYRHELHGPALLRACGDVKGLRVLDLGCGQGYFSRQLAKAGAKVTGVDVSEKQVANALRHERAEPQGIEYVVMDATGADERWPAGSFDLVTACMSLHDMPDPGRALVAADRVLAPAGRCVFSAVHPVMDVPQRGWDRDESGRKVMYKMGRYFDTGPQTCAWYMARLNRYWTTPIVRLTVDGWTGLTEQAGFLIRRIYEPRPTLEDVARCPNLEDCRDFPSFLVFDLVKA
ncbi:methyltransferase domain-containing protein, partial [candidate division WOR-3 bacterium]|nr:methyltransferase domain-containing protein [candidate division WOR-3 bacterium]